MAKGSKSSASSGTRKKNARKAAAKHGDDDDDEQQLPQQKQKPAQRGQKKDATGKKLSKAQRRALPKIKQYIPPPKPPAPPIPDPLDGQGLARRLPADLVVVLRRLGKKDDVTRRRGLEDLREQWLAPILQDSSDEEAQLQGELAEAALLAAIPVWLHNLASLLQSPFHRAPTLQVHDELLSIPALRGTILDSLAMSYLPGTQERDIIGSWLVAAQEEGRRNGGNAIRVWDEVTRFGRDTDGASESEHEGYTSRFDLMPHLPSLAEYFSLSTLDPETLHRDIHPPPVHSAFSSPNPKQNDKGGKGSKGARASPAPPATPEPQEEDAEAVEERLARYRVGGLVGLSWLIQKLPGAGVETPCDELLSLLSNPVLWSSLGTTTSMDLEPIGQQPPTRRAGYALLSGLIDSYPAQVEKSEMLQLISATLHGNCWNEKEAVVWETAGPAVVKFLTKYRQSWALAAASSGSADDNDEDEEEDGDDDDEADTPAASVVLDRGSTPAPGGDRSSKVFGDFLEFLSAVCPSIPHLTYPLLLLVVPTLPRTMLPLSSPEDPLLQNFFSHLWSPVDARLLSMHTLGSQPSAFQACLQAVLEVTTFLIEKAHSNSESDTAAWLVKDQLGSRAWGEGVLIMGARGGRRGAPIVETEATMMVNSVGKVVSISSEFVTTLMAEIERTTLEQCASPADPKRPFLPRALTCLTELRSAAAEIEKPVDSVILQVADGCTERLFHLSKTSATEQSEALVAILRQRSDLFPPGQTLVLSQALQAHITELVEVLGPQHVASLFDATAAVAGPEEKDALLTAIWSFIESSEGPQAVRFGLGASIVSEQANGLLTEGRLDVVATEAAGVILKSDDPVALSIASSSVVNPALLSTGARHGILESVSSAVYDAVDGLLTEGTQTAVPTSALSVLSAYAADGLEELVGSDVYLGAVVAVHHLVVLVPRLGMDVTVPQTASSIWEAAGKLKNETKMRLSAAISSSLAELLGRVACRVDPGTLTDVALATDIAAQPTAAGVAATMLPSPDELLSIMSHHTVQSPDPSLPIIEPLVACVTDVEEVITRASDFDNAGRSRAARLAEAALALLRADRALVQSLPYLLHVALGAMLLAEDGIAIPGASRGLYTAETATSHLEHVIRDAEGAISFSLSLVDEAPVQWHKDTVNQLKTGTVGPNADYLQRLLVELRGDVAKKLSDIAPRAFREVLQRHLRRCGAGEQEGEVWLTFALQMSEKLPEIAHAVIVAIKPFMLDTKPFTMAQNRLANGLAGINVQQANAKGLPAMRLLIASAPPSETASVFLPQQRAVFVLRHVAGWLTSEDEAADDLADEIDVRVAELYTAIAPIVQDLSGAHWDAMFDLVDGALSSSALDDPVSYPLLHAGLDLLREIRDLCRTNKSLRAEWVAKEDHLGLVVNLFTQCRNADSVPLQRIHALILDLLSDAGPQAIAKADFTQLCALLLESGSIRIQTTAYRLLSQVIKRRTIQLVVEAEATVAEDGEEEPKTPSISLPTELVAIAETGRDVDWYEGPPHIQTIVTQLLSWMSILDHFEDASRALRWAYLDQLNKSHLLESALIPLLFSMLGVSSGESDCLKPTAIPYAVDEFYPDLLEAEDLADLTPFASHVYYRALVTIPSAMRAYYESLKDRQQSLTMMAFTSMHYSPVINRNEFAALREPRAMAELTEEGLQVRIARTGGGLNKGGVFEAIASYTVDEQPMEISIRLPAEFPLKGVDVLDLQRVGVPANKWRGWLMNVQQTITSRNGLVLEALTMFKKNVALHFEGVVECAICYSIISVTDRTLPTKKCATCKNRFHASCLFKWFNSSNSSSCPLCRSLF